MKKLSVILAVLMLLVVFPMTFASAEVNYIINEDFETAKAPALMDTYTFNGAIAKLGKSPNAYSGSKSLLVSERVDFWGGFRIPLLSNKTDGTPILDFEKTYSLSCYVKFDADIDKISVSLQFYDANGNYHCPELFSNWEVGDQWQHMSGTFTLKELCAREGITSMPTDRLEIGFITESSKSDMFIDKLQLVEGTEVPGELSNDNDVWRDQHQEPPATETPIEPDPTKAPTTPGNNLVPPGGDKTTAADPEQTTAEGNTDNTTLADGDTQKTTGKDTDSTTTNVQDANNTPSDDDQGGGFPWLIVGIVAGCVVLIGGGVALYFLVLKKKFFVKE